MNEAKRRTSPELLGLGLILSAFVLALAGCFGYVQGPGGGVVVAEPDFYIFGGYGDGGHARFYGYRGAASRGYGGGWRR